MKKIISLYARNYDGDRLVRDEVVPGAEWVLNGEGVATVKLDGTCCMINGGKLFKRYEVKPGKQPPEGFIPETGLDEVTGKIQGWVAVGDGPEDRWHREAFAACPNAADGTYELIGPMVQGNAESVYNHILVSHHSKDLIIRDAPRDFEGLKAWFAGLYIEGLVWHHPDGRMVKIKAKDFGIKRKQTNR